MHTRIASHTIKQEIRENIALSVPLIASWLIYSFSSFIGTAMIARLGEETLAASVMIGSIWIVINVYFYGMFNSVSVLVSHRYGAEKHTDIGRIIINAFLAGLLFCIPTMGVMALTPYFLFWIAPSKYVLSLASEYAYSIMWATPGMIGLVIIENFLNGIGKTKLSLWISLFEVPLEIALFYMLIFGKLGLPAFGIAGVGYGFTISFSCTFVVLLIYLFYADFAQPFQLFRKIFNFEKRYLWEIVRIGLPVGLMYLIEVSAFTLATFLMARFGTMMLAAQQIAMQFLGVTVNIPYAMGQAVSIRIGQSAGRLDIQGVKQAGYIGVLLSFSCILIVAMMYFFYPHILLRLDLNTADPANINLVRQASIFLSILGVFQLVDSLRVSETSVLRALKDTRFPLVISVISFWLVGILCAFLFVYVFKTAGTGIWYGLTLGITVGALILFLRIRYVISNVDLARVIAI